MIRAFIAVRIDPAPALMPLLKTLAGCGRPVRPIAPEQLHLTLRFLGAIDADAAPDIVAAMQLAVARTRVFDVRLVGLGAFPQPDRPRIVWVALRGTEPLDPIVHRLDPLLDSLNLSPRDHPWRPHLTVARVKAKPPAELLDLIRSHRSSDFKTQSIKAVRLVQSTLSPAGPTYHDLHCVALTPRS